MDAFNAVDSTTFEMDRDLGTQYHQRFRDYLRYVQEEDLTVDGAMTDPKGDRGLRPFQQADPDLFMRVVEKNADGIVVRGAKCHQTGKKKLARVLVGIDDCARAMAIHRTTLMRKMKRYGL